MVRPIQKKHVQRHYRNEPRFEDGNHKLRDLHDNPVQPDQYCGRKRQRQYGDCDQTKLQILNEKIISRFGQTTSSELIWKSENNINVEKEAAEKLFKLLNILEENDDIQVVSSNFEVSDEILSSLTM